MPVIKGGSGHNIGEAVTHPTNRLQEANKEVLGPRCVQTPFSPFCHPFLLELGAHYTEAMYGYTNIVCQEERGLYRCSCQVGHFVGLGSVTNHGLAINLPWTLVAATRG